MSDFNHPKPGVGGAAAERFGALREAVLRQLPGHGNACLEPGIMVTFVGILWGFDRGLLGYLWELWQLVI